MSDAPPPVKPPRKPFDPLTMGFGKHKYEHIDPDQVDINPGPPGGIRTRDFTTAKNHKHVQTDMTLDLLSRPGTVFETNLEGFEGDWIVVYHPAMKDGAVTVRVRRLTEGAETERMEISAVALGVVADRFTAMFNDQVWCRLKDGGSAGREIRERLTRLTYQPRVVPEEEIEAEGKR